MAENRRDRLESRLLALNIRLHELDVDLHRTQLRVNMLQSLFDDLRLARAITPDGPEAPPTDVAAELARETERLEAQRQVVEHVRSQQWDARVRFALEMFQQRKAAQASALTDPTSDEAA